MFAETSDIATRLLHPLSAPESEAAEQLLEAVTEEILQIAGIAEGAFSDGQKAVAKRVSIEAVVRGLSNPGNLDSQSETLGAYSHTDRYRASDGGFLTQQEELSIRRATGTLSGSTHTPALPEDVYVIENP